MRSDGGGPKIYEAPSSLRILKEQGSNAATRWGGTSCSSATSSSSGQGVLDAIHKQRSLHRDELIAEETNAWKATCSKPDEASGWSKGPPLQKADGPMMKSTEEQAEQLLETFFPALLENIGDERQS